METCQTKASEAIEVRSGINSHFARYKVLFPGAAFSFLLSFLRSFVRSFFFLIVFWFILLAGYYRCGEGGQCELPAEPCSMSFRAAVSGKCGRPPDGLLVRLEVDQERERERERWGVVGCLSIKCHRCSIALVFPQPRPVALVLLLVLPSRCDVFVFFLLGCLFALLCLAMAYHLTIPPLPPCPLLILVVVVLVLSGVWPPYLCTCRIALHT